ncbi:MAG: HAD family hydrolase [Candidatus Staskawiczbacteria bacterium]|jgi:HAD superfamily hydrolase (TIGR01490 family)
MKFVIAAFDFDGTIVKKDTFLDFILYSCSSKRAFFGGIKSMFVLLLFVSKIISSDSAKEKIFSIFFKGMSADTFARLCKNYSLNRLPQMIKKQAFQKIQWHKQQGHKLVIVSASIEDWIKPWAEKNDFEKVIATATEAKNGILTGKFRTKNCNKEEKVKRLLQEYPNKENYYLYAYGDNHKDKQFLEMADEAFYGKF